MPPVDIVIFSPIVTGNLLAMFSMLCILAPELTLGNSESTGNKEISDLKFNIQNFIF
jgi:hypothetical protein